MMKVYEIGAGGYRAVGLIIVIAGSKEHAAELANKHSRELAADKRNPDYNLTYHALNAKVLDGVLATTEPAHRWDHRQPEPRVLTMREYGMPELPSAGSGRKVTF